MATKKALTLSIVIPAYNEENHLAACLDAIADQMVAPDEVIVVDNNSTDNTAVIAAAYPFVTLVNEKRQGRAHARTKGFNTAKSEIIGRIDADSVVAQDWVEQAKASFTDPRIVGVTGLGRTNVLPWLESVHMTLWSRVYFWLANAYFGVVTMWGANMAIRRTAWLKIKDDVCLEDDLAHEDQDVSLLLIGTGGLITQNNRLLIKSNGQTYVYWPKFSDYILRTMRSKSRYEAMGVFTRNRAARIRRLPMLPQLSFSLALTLVFAIVSFVAWPITAYLHKVGRHGR